MIPRPHMHRQKAAHNVHSFSITAFGAFNHCTLELGVKIRALPSPCSWHHPVLVGFVFFSPVGLKLMLADAVWSVLSLAQIYRDIHKNTLKTY